MMMRRWLLAIVALLSLPSAAYAAFAIFQTYAPPATPQIFYNIVTDGGASCVGDQQTITRNVTMVTTPSPANRNLNVSVNTFSPSDVGKFIKVPGAAGGAGTLQTTITAYVDAQNVTLAGAAFTAKTNVATAITYGHDDAPAFTAFNTWARANQGSSQVVLTIPPGSHCWFGTGAFGYINTSNPFAAGINNLIVEGNGSTLNGDDNGGGFWLGNLGVCQQSLSSATGCTARIQSVSPGSSTITLTSASQAAGYSSRFPVGRWLMIGGLDTQGQWLYACGYPPNPTYFEWRQVTANPGTGVITLDRPISGTYLDTWPGYNEGAPTSGSGGCSGGEADNGGPATIWAVGGTNNTWGATLEYRSLTLRNPGQIYVNSRNATFRDVVFPTGSGLGAIPTQNETFTAINTTWNAVIEADKMIGTFTLDNSSLTLLQFQSNSTDLFIARNGTTFSTGLHGGGKRSELTDVTIADFRPGSYAYGNTPGPVICTRCNVAAWQNNGIFQNDNPSPYSMASGVISFPNTAAFGGGPAQRWASTIGKTIFYAASGFSSLGVFTVTGLTQDPTNTYIQTDQAGGFPNFATLGGGTQPWFSTNGAQQFTCDACTGTDSFVGLNIQAGATPLAPLGTFSKRSFTPSAQTNNLGLLYAVGKITSLTIDVTTASTHTGSITLNPTGQAHLFTIKQSNWTQFDWMPSINAKQAGKRVYTNAGGGTGSWTCDTGGGPVAGGCSGDTVTGAGLPPEQVWIQSGISPGIFGTFTGGVNPTFTITIKTDQTP